MNELPTTVTVAPAMLMRPVLMRLAPVAPKVVLVSKLMVPALMTAPLIDARASGAGSDLDGAVGGVGERAAAGGEGVGIAVAFCDCRRMVPSLVRPAGHGQGRVASERGVALHPDRRVGQVVGGQVSPVPSTRMVVGDAVLAVT